MTEEQKINNEEAISGQENIIKLDEAKNTSLSDRDTILSLQQELLEARDRTMRALADAENTRRRAQKDREDAGKFAITGFARDLLAFSDNFKRALDSMPDNTPVAIMEGLKAMDSELLSTFERHGIQKIEPLDQPFDANFHEVMFEAPVPGKSAGTIIQVIEAGYVIKDRLLRAAKVGIAKGDPSAPKPEQGLTLDESI